MHPPIFFVYDAAAATLLFLLLRFSPSLLFSFTFLIEIINAFSILVRSL